MIWLVLGIIIGSGMLWLLQNVKEGKTSIKWYQWVLGMAAVIMLLLTIENYLGFQEELEPVAANLVIIAMGLPAVTLGALAWFTPKFVGKVGSKSEDKVVC